MKDSQKTKVMFRKFKDQGVIALFPEECGTTNYETMMSYMHVGQHGHAYSGIGYDTKPASPKEYADLKKELVSIGYNLQIVKRMRESFTQERKRKLNIV